ncbi:MAG: DNA starvation/stationary phase protection protein Dps [Acidobacteria bacterium]|nr:MAG: DNA starvation/stationary phase protection protein Dps [Acidobacteriota bacterium]
MYRSPSALKEDARKRLAQSLNGRLADGLDLHNVYGTVRHAAKASSLPEYEAETRRDLDHVRLLADRIEAYLKGLRETRDLGETEDDQDTVDLLTGIIEEFEKHGWFLRATLEG